MISTHNSSKTERRGKKKKNRYERYKYDWRKECLTEQNLHLVNKHKNDISVYDLETIIIIKLGWGCHDFRIKTEMKIKHFD